MTWRLRPNAIIAAEIARLAGSIVGPTGPAGATGAAGPLGDIGAAGPLGVPGTDGALGLPGLAGAAGPAGAAGVAGANGVTGASPTGAAGPAGAAGVAGAAGLAGAAGPAGATGPARTAGPAPLLLTPLNAATFGGRDIDADTVTMFVEIPSGAPAVTRVDFLVGAAIVGTALAAPWQFQWPTTQGSYNVTAKVTYADATVGTSAVAAITVAAPTTAPLPTATAQVKAWADPTHANTLNPGGTQAAIGDQVASLGRFKDGTIVTTQFTQATTTKRCRLGLWRGKKVLETCTNSTTTENYAATLSGSQGFPSTLMPTYRCIGTQTTGVLCGHGGVANIEELGTTWPRTDRCLTSVVVDDTIAQATGQSTRFVLNNTNSEVWRNGSKIHGPVASGTTGLSVSITFPGHTGGSADPGYAADHVYAQGTVSGTDATNLDNYFNAKFDLLAPQKRILYIGDSQGIVFGLTNGGWRKLLHDYLHAGKICGAWIEEIGFKLEGGLRFFGGDVHDCVSGKGVNYHANTTPGAGGISTLLGAGLQWQPDIVFLEIGVNNAASSAGETYVAGTGAGSTRAVAQTLITQILTGMPAPGQLILADLFPDQVAGTQTNIATLNATWFSDADATAAGLGRTIVHANWNAALNGPNFDASLFQPDNHLNDLGCAASFKEFIRCVAKSAYKHTNGIA